jgi:hypothetical protein
MRTVCVFVLGLFALTSVRAQTGPNDPAAGLGKDVALGVIVGIVVVAVAAIGITYYVLHKGVAEGCVAEAGGKRTLVDSNKKVYSLLDGGSALFVGDQVKLKGHKSGPKSAPSIQLEKVLKVYGPCKP